MTITQFGRVELDITQVPSSTVGSRASAERFADRLSEAARSHGEERNQPQHERVDSRNPEPAENIEVGHTASVPADEPAPTPVHGTTVSEAPADTTASRAAESILQGEGSVRRSAAGKDPGPSSPFVTRHAARLEGGQGLAVGATDDRGAGTGPTLSGPAGTLAGNPAGAGNSPGHSAGSSDRGGPGPARAVGEPASGSGRTGFARPASQAGYRTVNPMTLRAAEAAHNSVIKLIAMRLNGDRGDMRVQLDPPELGRLHIRLVVEKGAVLQLNIVAERPEVAMMLEKHMPELRQALAGQGLDLSGADVHTGLFDQREHGWGGWSRDGRDAASDSKNEFENAPQLRHVGYVTAEGLDFFV